MKCSVVYSFAVLLVFWTSVAVASLPVADTFQNYDVGYSFSTPTNNWSASPGVMVTNHVNRFSDVAASNSVALSASAILTNQVASNTTSAVWTDFHIKPCTGDYPDVPPTNVSSHVQYYNNDGYVVVALSNGWHVCSNDVWGAPVTPVTNDWIHISLYQNYGSSNSALMVNDQLVLQDMPFVGNVPSYSRFIIQNPDSGAWLDDVWIQTTYNPVLVSNRNGDAGGLAEAHELQLYGYAARTQYVGTGSGYPVYPSITAALSAWRARDWV